jgi:Subtilisin-like serine proteases
MLLVILFLFIILNHKNYSPLEKNDEIVIVFDNNINDNNLGKLVKSIDTDIRIINHIENYALIQVLDMKKYYYILSSLKKSSIVKIAEANITINILGTDSYFSSQWALDNTGFYSYISDNNNVMKESNKDIDMDVVEAWNYMGNSKDDNTVVVAVLDTGVDYNHPDLRNNMWINEGELPDDGIDNDQNGYVDDIYGWDFFNNDSTICHYLDEDNNIASPLDDDNHGTHIAGIIAAIKDNDIGIAGVASNIKIRIMSLKINGGPNGTGTVSDAIEAIKYATKMGADICNLSWGSIINNEVLNDIIMGSDLLFIVAAGNSGNNNDITPFYPSSLQYDNVISVAYINAMGKLSDKSNYGLNTVDIAAPGEDIYSTIVGGYGYMSGSSMAAPYVTAVCALLYSNGDGIYPSNVKDILVSSIKKMPSLNGFIKNPGIPSAYFASLNENLLIKDTTKPIITFNTSYTKRNITVEVHTLDLVSGVRIIKYLKGLHTLNDFMHGTIGIIVKNKQITTDRGRQYTFYISDYAGNEMVVNYHVIDDITPPALSIKSSKNKIIINAKDNQSGIKIVKYLYGKKEKSDFTHNGKCIKLNNGNGVFSINQRGDYTIYISDNRGNIIIKQFSV